MKRFTCPTTSPWLKLRSTGLSTSTAPGVLWGLGFRWNPGQDPFERLSSSRNLKPSSKVRTPEALASRTLIPPIKPGSQSELLSAPPGSLLQRGCCKITFTPSGLAMSFSFLWKRLKRPAVQPLFARCWKFHPEIQQRDAKAHTGGGFLVQKTRRSEAAVPKLNPF